MRRFIRFLQQSVEMGKTSAEVSTESSTAGDHNIHHPADTLLLSFATRQRERAVNDFDLHTPARILFDKDAITELCDQIPRDARVLVTYGGDSVKKTGVLAQVQGALEDLDVLEFGGIEPNPSYETLMNVIKVVHDKKVTLLLAVGDGSVLNGTKFIAATAQYVNSIDPWRILETHGSNIASAIPIGSVLALPVTDSGSNFNAVISRKTTGDKLTSMTPSVQPISAVLGPVYAYTLPPRQVTNGVVDVFVHTMEQYVTYSVDRKIQDRFIGGTLLTLVKEGPRVLQESGNYNVHANIMWTVTQALNGLIDAGVPQDQITHVLGHELTTMHGLDHIQTLAIVLPTLWDKKRGTKRARLLQYAEHIWNITEGLDDQCIGAAIATTHTFLEQMDIPTHLSDYSLDGSSIPTLLEKLEAHDGTRLGEHQDITLEVDRRIYGVAR